MDTVLIGAMLACLCGIAMGQNYVVLNAVNSDLMSCYECNVWKAGYGQLCDNPRIRTGCYACMKVETIIFMGYYKNTPRYSTVISRACANSKSVPFYHECQYFQMGDGHSRRCYCNTPLCNKAAPPAATNALPILGICALISSMANFIIRHLY
jgi:hypothetical protein